MDCRRLCARAQGDAARHHRRTLRLALSGCLLAMLLVLAQQHAVLHWLSHAGADVAPHAKHAVQNDQCDQCVGLGSLGLGMAASGWLLLLSFAHHACPAVARPRSAPAELRLAYLSRAPPGPA
ncbi:MAG: hypothetical protein JWQ33_125 [Ramlibacter sp.]|nr:hypothetical protein [Ramlibacter sp.]